MAFILEELTDEQREQMGFAKTRGDIKLPNGRRCSFVSHWVIDREREAYFMPTGVNDYELHWKNDVIYVKALFTPIKTSHEIRKIAIPKVLEDKQKDVMKLVLGGLSAYGNGRTRKSSHLKGTAELSDNLETRFPDRVKSKVKLIDFETVQ